MQKNMQKYQVSNQTRFVSFFFFVFLSLSKKERKIENRKTKTKNDESQHKNYLFETNLFKVFLSVEIIKIRFLENPHPKICIYITYFFYLILELK